MPELPPSNLSRVPAGTDVRDLGREINKVIEALNIVCGIVRSLSRFDRPNAPPPHFPGRGGGFPTHVVFRAAGSTAIPTQTGRFLWIDTVNETLTWSSSNVNPNPGIIIILDSERREFVVQAP